ncbi:unnamed protein product [Rotaria magnacalcarata]|uniref:FYVE-type domain-containing protein n=1 Tax=Rotaria magnacalcarata TaxID=392030 RepID=A0A820AXS2_9BILA|nr:unnamed protein product [Rotaria magnacalcarata]CAF1636422.1 unnamed protein product [Rotaria magnacalcarata]CAF1942241.1 unnamed protein product [Rotaria magnacalcarata]CAF2098602.1 unnamed protein product [Rotaria magnacalcarata]CAF4183012.1 unnamed protein product [Rotaria magnacalcarata]
MSNSNTYRLRSIRKPIKPVIDIDEVEDDKRRDSFGRKRVVVIECLLDSSSDDNDDVDIGKQNSNKILWLTFAEICHIRSVLAEATHRSRMFNTEKQYSKIFQNELCFRCQKPIKALFFISSFFYANNSPMCYICQQKICKNCSILNFLPPSPKHCFPVRVQALIKSSSTPIENHSSDTNESNAKKQTICYDCSKIFDQYRRPSQYSIKPPVEDRSQSFMSLSMPFNKSRYRHDSHASTFIVNDNAETMANKNILVTRF